MTRLLALVLVAGLWLATTGASWLQFQSLPADGSEGITVTGLLRVPEGEGPFPATILLADCDGISPHEREWGVRFAEQGFVVYLLDSFFTRNVETACDGTPVPVMDDLSGALAKLATLDDIDMDRIVVVGWGTGADVALEWAAIEGDGVVVAFYPSCAATPDIEKPVLMVLPDQYADSVACNDYLRAQYEAGLVPVQRIAPYGVGAGFDCAQCEGGYLGGPGGWNEPAATLVTENLWLEIDRLLVP